MKLKELLEVVPPRQEIQIIDDFDNEIVYYEDEKQYFKRESIENKNVVMVKVVDNGLENVLQIAIEI